MTSEQLQPLTIGEAFPADDLAGQWVIELAMAMNDIATLDGLIHDALEHDRPESGYLFRLLCGALREMWELFNDVLPEHDRDGQTDEIERLLDYMAGNGYQALMEVRALFVRSEPKTPDSWGETHLKGVRDLTFHYPRAGSDELGKALKSAADVHACIAESGPRPFDFADVVAMHAAFGDIDKPDERTRYDEILETSRWIAERLVPVVWGAIAAYCERRGIDPHRFDCRNG